MQKSTRKTKKAGSGERKAYSTLPKGNRQRARGYLWIVERRVGKVRSRKFFRNGEAKERDEYIEKIDKQIAELAKGDRDILGNHKLLEEASRANKDLEPFGKTITDAVKHYTDFLRNEQVRDKTPVSEVVEKFLASKEGQSERHYNDLRCRLSKFEEAFGDRHLSSLTKMEIKKWILSLGLRPQTLRNYRDRLKNLFHFALSEDIITGESPMRFLKLDDPDEQEITTISPQDVSLLLSNATRELLPALVLMVFCGIRNAEIVKKKKDRKDLFLDWSKINWKSKTITIDGKQAKKTRRKASRRIVTIPDNAIEWLLPLKKEKGKIANFRTADLFNHALTKHRKQCGFGKGKWPSNALRKTFISCHYSTFEDVKKTAFQAGNSPGTIRTYYLDLVEKDVAETLWQILPEGAEKP